MPKSCRSNFPTPDIAKIAISPLSRGIRNECTRQPLWISRAKAQICFGVATGYNFSNQRSSSFSLRARSVAYGILQTVLAFLFNWGAAEMYIVRDYGDLISDRVRTGSYA